LEQTVQHAPTLTEQITAFHAASPLHSLVSEVEGIAIGRALYGTEGGIDLVYDGAKVDRASAIAADVVKLSGAGFQVRTVGRNLRVAIDLTPVSFGGQTKYTK
jgi:hypothetical protein